MSKKPKLYVDELLKPLSDEQHAAATPADHIWLNASAGTGKTQVLSARVLRLLLAGAAPESILCITFTKAGAAEMAGRVHNRLARWVACTAGDLNTDLLAIGVDHHDPAQIARARGLFAQVIDSPIGAVRVQTIHSFCQSLLANFPLEAGLLPGFRLIEGSEEARVQAAALSDLFDPADPATAERLIVAARFSQRRGADAAGDFIARAARVFGQADVAALAPHRDDLRRTLDLPVGDGDAWMAGQIASGAIADADVAAILDAAENWRTKAGETHKDGKLVIAGLQAWFDFDQPASARIASMCGGLGTGKMVLRAAFADDKPLGSVGAVAEAMFDRLSAMQITLAAMQYTDDVADGLALGADFAELYALRKLREGFADFDDLIGRAGALLRGGDRAEWIRYKLDQRIDHVLVDEAQDTNERQWDIVKGLVDEFFAGAGAKDDRMPSLFVVGDPKQAIFGFQGTDPHSFSDAYRHFTEKASDPKRPLSAIDLPYNYRSSSAILGFVDHWLNAGGASAMGLAHNVAKHSPKADKPGRVETWPPLVIAATAKNDTDAAETEDGDGDEAAGNGGDDSLNAATDPASLALAKQLATRVRGWIDHGIDGRVVKPGDIMILVRTRRALAARIVAQLQASDVAVEGVDRFALSAPLAVQDLLAAMRFVVQPQDQLSLASLLVSPLIGWDQQTLYDECGARGDTGLWPWVRTRASEPCAAACARLEPMLAMADFSTPYRFLESALGGPGVDTGRRRMLARFGSEADDAIDALLAEALAFEAHTVPTLAAFVDAIESRAIEIKRPTDTRADKVRVMTVHGSKGLQAPIVILADATADPAAKKAKLTVDMAGWRGLPLLATNSSNRSSALTDLGAKADAAALAEHWRLFYVAATRAESMLVLTGTLGVDRQGSPKTPPPDSWYAAADATLAAIGCAADPAGTPVRRHQVQPANWPKRKDDGGEPPAPARVNLPDWAYRPAPEEARPPRPLAPSTLIGDDVAASPQGQDRQNAIQRGVLIHALFERLPDVARENRAAAADAWLARQDPALTPAQRAEMADGVIAVLGTPDWSPLFGQGSLAEAPFSAVVDGQVIAGTVDRLLVTDDAVLVVDYKTGGFVPASANAVQPAYLRQMAAYAAALAVIFPSRRIEAALLYSAGPTLIALDADVLAAHKPVFAAQ